MTIAIEPATAERFDDVRTILGPKREGAQGCWCLSIRLGPKADRELRGEARAEAIAELCRRPAHAPGVLAYDEAGEVVGWCGVAPIEALHEVSRGARYRVLEDRDGVWAIWCLRIRAGQGGRGHASALVEGAARYAEERGAKSVVGFPVDSRGGKVDRTLASVARSRCSSGRASRPSPSSRGSAEAARSASCAAEGRAPQRG